MDLTVLVALVLGSVVLLLFFAYRRLTCNYGYWEAQDIPTVKPQLFYGSTKEMFTKAPHIVEDERIQKYGHIYGTYEFFKRAINIADPELARQILVKDFHIFTNRRDFGSGFPVLDDGLTQTRDEKWKRIRNVVSPSFTSGKMKKMNCHFVEAAEGLIHNFTVAADDNEVLDAKTYFGSYSLDVTGLCAFGIRVDSLKNPNHPFVANTRKITARDISPLTLLAFFVPAFSRIFMRLVLKKLGLFYFIDITKKIIEERTSSDGKVTQVDFIQLMLDAREGKNIDDDKKEPEPAGQDIKKSEPAEQDKKQKHIWNVTKTLSDTEIQAQALQFLIVGHEVVSTALSFVAYELALNPDIQDRLFEEVVAAHKAHGEFNYDTVSKMPYLEAVISETLRLHTIASRAEREASEDYVLGSTGIKLHKGDLVIVLIHAIHHDPEFYPDPYTFRPERFLPENCDLLTPFTFLPFAEGPRVCLGQRFVLLEMKLCIAMVLRKIKFIATNETNEPIEYFKAAGLLSPKKIMLRVEKRD